MIINNNMKKGFTLAETLVSMSIVASLSGFMLNAYKTSMISKVENITQSSPLAKDLKAAYATVFINAVERGYIEHIDFKTTKNNVKIEMIDNCLNGRNGFQLIAEYDCRNEEDIEKCEESNTQLYIDSCESKTIQIKNKE